MCPFLRTKGGTSPRASFLMARLPCWYYVRHLLQRGLHVCTLAREINVVNSERRTDGRTDGPTVCLCGEGTTAKPMYRPLLRSEHACRADTHLQCGVLASCSSTSSLASFAMDSPRATWASDLDSGAPMHLLPLSGQAPQSLWCIQVGVWCLRHVSRAWVRRNLETTVTVRRVRSLVSPAACA